MSRSLRITFLVHAIVAFLMGVPLLVAPGRWLSLFGWAPIDPLMSRMFGAALLAMAWSSVRGYLAEGWDQVEIVVELEAVFTVLASIGLLRHLLIGTWPWYTWTILGIFGLFAVAWIYHLVKKR